MARTVKQLNVKSIDNAKGKDKPYTLTDGNGLFLLVQPSGSKTWQFNYFKPVTKKRVKFSLGAYPTISLSDARTKREEYRALLAQGIDPQERNRQAQQVVNEQVRNTFLAIAEKWKEKKATEIEPLTLKKNWRRLETYVFPTLGNMPVIDILPNVVIEMLEPLNKQGKGDTLKRIIRLINEILNYAVNYGLLPFNPCLNVNAVFNFGKNENNPTISPEELPALLRKIQHSKLSLFTRCLLRFQLLTMTRPAEASNAEWAEIDLDKKEWLIPPEKMKTRKAHRVPLSRQSLEVLVIMYEFTNNAQYVFQSARARDKPMNSQTANKALVDLGYKNKLTAHGLRSIASTYLNEKLINYDVIEACLSHGIKDQVRKAYNRSDYFEERKTVMQLWGDYVEQCER